MNPDPLTELRAYHLPEPIGWWPPAPGWWLLALLTLLSVALLVRWLLRRRTRQAARRAARHELQRLRRAYRQNADYSVLLRGLSQLLRRYALSGFAQDQVAGLTGEAWLAFLDRHAGGDDFRNGPGRALMDGPYRPCAEGDSERLLALVEAWIERNPEALP